MPHKTMPTSLLKSATRWVEKGLHHLLPRVCSLCELDLEGDAQCLVRLCMACEERLPGRLAARCQRCGLTHESTAPVCSLTNETAYPWDAVIAWVDYAYPVDGWIHALKFQKDSSLAHGLGWGFAKTLSQSAPEVFRRVAQLDALIPVPLSRKRLTWRGFNQAHLIAENFRSGLAYFQEHTAKVPARLPELRPDILLRTKDGPALSSLPAEGRHRLIQGAYTLNPKIASNAGGAVQGLRLGLIDDVMTTGATLAEATQSLKAAGAAEVIVLVLARTA